MTEDGWMDGWMDGRTVDGWDGRSDDRILSSGKCRTGYTTAAWINLL
jgi:hypothetical protein